jgi:hypothetical protein
MTVYSLQSADRGRIIIKVFVSGFQAARYHHAEDLSVKEPNLSYIALSQSNKCNVLLITIVAVSLLTVWQHGMAFHVVIPFSMTVACTLRDILDA